MEEILNAIGPILILIGVGFVAAALKVLPADAGVTLSRYLFYFSMPFLIFSNIYAAKPEDVANTRFLIGYFLTLCLSAVLGLMIFGWGFGLRRSTLIVQVMGGFYANATYVGVPVCLLTVGSAIPPLLILLVQTIIFLPLISALLDFQSIGKSSLSLGGVLKILAVNPILMAGVCALGLRLIGFQVPVFLVHGADLLGKPAMTVGLFSLGYTCYLSEAKGFRRRDFLMATVAAAQKVILQPLAALWIGTRIVGLTGWWVKSLVVCAALPCAVNAFVLSQRYQAAENESKLTLMFSTVLFLIVMTAALPFLS